MADKIAADTKPASDAEVDLEARRAQLSPEQHHVTQQKGTERAFSGEYWDSKVPGTYSCVVCDADLFTSETKYDSGTGWPSFSAPIAEEQVVTETDSSLGMTRTEVMCASCGAHLGHVFPDGPQPSGDRFCMNSASLKLLPKVLDENG